ncbi:hypothetical protein K438DRAFT_1852639 [Mycena galopus ATCC 62051]|nr:hypothetical protein K438DRAFT_1852639 [Mycena galopus ATCC 62051]
MTLDSRARSARASSWAWGSARATLLAEGAHGGLTKQAVAIYDLRNGMDTQTQGIGVKEERRHVFGACVSLFLFHYPPLPRLAAFRAHLRRRMAGGLVSIGLVVRLDYKNLYLAPSHEFQRTKDHLHFRALLAGDIRLTYGARAHGGLPLAIAWARLPGRGVGWVRVFCFRLYNGLLLVSETRYGHNVFRHTVRPNAYRSSRLRSSFVSRD